MFRMCKILVNMVTQDDSMPKKFYCILKLGYVKKMKFPPHVGDCASKGLINPLVGMTSVPYEGTIA